MRPRWYAVAAAAFLAMAAPTMAHTAGLSIGPSRAAYSRVITDGATLDSYVFTVAGDGVTITGATVRLVGAQGTKVVRVRFGTAPQSLCGSGTYEVGVPGRTTFACTGLSQNLNTSTVFSISVADS